MRNGEVFGPTELSATRELSTILLTGNWETLCRDLFFFNRTLSAGRHSKSQVVLHYSGEGRQTAGKDAYYNSYRVAKNLFDYVGGANAKFGPTHLDDSFLILKNDRIDPTTTENDRAMLNIMLDFWYYVAATSEPNLNVDLPKIDPNSSKFKYLDIDGPDDFVSRSSDDFGEKKFCSSFGFDFKV